MSFAETATFYAHTAAFHAQAVAQTISEHAKHAVESIEKGAHAFGLWFSRTVPPLAGKIDQLLREFFQNMGNKIHPMINTEIGRAVFFVAGTFLTLSLVSLTFFVLATLYQHCCNKPASGV